MRRAQRAAGTGGAARPSGGGAAAEVRLPVPRPDRSEGRRRPARAVEARRRVRHRVGAVTAGAHGAVGDHRGPDPAPRPHADESRDRRHRPARRPRPARRSAAGDLRPQPPQPPRHRPDDPVRALRLAARPRRRRGRRLLLRQALEGGVLGARAERHPDRSRGHRPQVVRHDPRPHRRRLQPRDLSRRAAARPTAGVSRSRAARHICRAAPARPSCRCSSTAPGRSSARG